MRQAERQLQREVVARLKFAPLQALLIPSPNGVFLPTRNPIERDLARRIIHQLKNDGQMAPGAPDLVFLWAGGSGCIELKRPESRRLFDKQRAGSLSDTQKLFKQRCDTLGVPYVACQSWPEVRDTLIDWGCLPNGWIEAERRIGRAA